MDINQFYNTNRTTTITPEQLVAIKGEPIEKENWNYEINSKTSYPITSYRYSDGEEYNFYKGYLSWILIVREIEYSSKGSILSMFGLKSTTNTKETVDNGFALRYTNCGVSDFWVQIKNNKIWCTKIKLVDSPF